MRGTIMMFATSVMLALASSIHAQEPGWTGRIIKPAAERARLEATPIINRPYRPLHFYGNTVRRQYYHGRVLPRPVELAKATGAWMFRR